MAAVHAHLRGDVRYSMGVGKSHHAAPPARVEHGPRPETFFAPGVVAERLAEWGAEDYRRRLREGLTVFIAQSHAW